MVTKVYLKVINNSNNNNYNNKSNDSNNNDDDDDDEQGLLHVPFACTSAVQSRAFSVVGPLAWNGLQLAFLSLPRVFSQKFLQQLKQQFGRTGVGSTSPT